LNTQNITQFSLTSTGDIDFIGGSSVFGGSLDLNATDDININAIVETLGSGGVGLTAFLIFGAGNFTVGSLGQVISHNTQINVVANSIDLQGLLKAGTGPVDLTAFTGGITGGNGISIIAGTANLNAFSGIGTSANPLNTSIDILIAATTSPTPGSGIFINETDDITLQSLTTVNGNINVTSGGIITLGTINPGGGGTFTFLDNPPPPPPVVDESPTNSTILEEFSEPPTC